MELELRLSGTASLVQIHTPDPDVGRSHHEYYARIRADNGSINGRERPLRYDLPLTKEEFDRLKEQADIFEKPNPAHESWTEVPCIKVKCVINLTTYEGK
ncbi:MAG: hypothetical protein Q8N99_08945 [Nanoarchaeota archaeon]|nr:hypothetical protein [Nanoarchaeota archaeon]